jgi:hypothetical protein
METKRLSYLEARGFLFWLSVCSLPFGGCERGPRESTPPRVVAVIAQDRYEQVQVRIDGKPADLATTLTAGRNFSVTVSFRRRHVWPDLVNHESLIDALVLEQGNNSTLTRRNPGLDFQSEKDGLLTFQGNVDGVPELGIFSFRIQENVFSEAPGIQRYCLFATDIRNVKR